VGEEEIYLFDCSRYSDIIKLMKIAFKIAILTLIIVFFVFLNLTPVSSKVKNAIYLLSTPVQKWFFKTGAKISDFFETISEIKNLKIENEELKLRTQELIAQNLILKELKTENEILRKSLEIGLEKEFKLILVETIGKDISQDFLLINKGSKDGLSKNLPVITQQKTLVGKITEVYENFSKVMLLTDKESSFDAEIPEKEIYGVVKGRGNFKLFLDLIPQDKEIKEGDLVVTSSLGGVFPRGILVGEIKEIKKSDVELFQKAEIQPALDIKELKFLFVILEW
jgi:rod shape-determining protein MreC